MLAHITIEGYVEKKRPKGLAGLKSWQTRYFVVDTRHITYSKKKDSEVLGRISIFDIKKLDFLPGKRTGSRFDIVTKSGRTYSCDTKEDNTQEWIEGIRLAVQMAKEDKEETLKLCSIIKDRKPTQLQVLFYNAKYGELAMTDRPGKGSEQKVVLEEIDKSFATDESVLTYLLTTLFNPAVKLFDFERKEDDLEGLSSPKSPVVAISGSAIPKTVKELLDQIGAKLGVDLSQWLTVFENNNIGTMKDLQTAGVPEGLPKRLTETIHSQLAHFAEGAENEESEAARLFNMIASDQAQGKMVRAITNIFSSSANENVHALAVRFLWGMYFGQYSTHRAALQFNEQIKIHCSESHMTMTMKKALIHLLIATPSAIVNDLGPYKEVGMRMLVVRPVVWKGVLGAFAGTDFAIREKALADINTLLWDNLPNCDSLRSDETWLASLMGLLIDVRKSEIIPAGPQKAVYNYLLNTLTLVNFEYFQKTDVFPSVFNDMMSQLHAFGGSNQECMQVANKLLEAMTSKLTAKKGLFSTSMFEDYGWKNLFDFLAVVKNFIFHSAYWQSAPFVGLQMECEENKKELGHIGEEDDDDDNWPLDKSSLSMNLSGEFVSWNGGHTPGGGVDDVSDGFDKSYISLAKGQCGNESSHAYSRTALDPDFEFVIAKRKLDKKDRTWVCEQPEVKDFGVHWTLGEGSVPFDMELVDKVSAFFKASQIDRLNPELEGITEKDHLDKINSAKLEILFWEDTLAFLRILNRDNIAKKKLFTYRQLSYLCQDFLSRETHRGRLGVIKKLEKLSAGQTLNEEDDAYDDKTSMGPYVPVFAKLGGWNAGNTTNLHGKATPKISIKTTGF